MLSIFLLSVLLFLYWKFSSWRKTTFTFHFFTGLGLHLSAGILVGLVFKYYHQGGDTFELFKDASFLRNIALKDFSAYLGFLFFNEPYYIQFPEVTYYEPRALLMSKTISIVNILTFNNYWLTSLWFSAFSFWACWQCVILFSQLFETRKKAVLLAFIYYPSLCFWTSGILKESLLFGFLAIIITSFLKIIYAKELSKTSAKSKYAVLRKIVETLLFLLSLWFLWKLKYYYFAILLPVLVSFGMVVFLQRKFHFSIKKQFIAYLLSFTILIILATVSHPNLNINSFVKVIVRNNQLMAAQTTKTENLINFQQLKPTIKSVIKNLPIAIWEGFTRPYLWEKGHWTKKIVAFENTAFLGLLFFVIFKKGTLLLKPKQQELFDKGFLLLGFALLIYVFLLGTLLTLAAPNIGNLVRYKIGFMPFFLLGLLLQLEEPQKKIH